MKLPKLNVFKPDCPRVRIYNPNIDFPSPYCEPQNKYWEECRKNFEKEKNKL